MANIIIFASSLILALLLLFLKYLELRFQKKNSILEYIRRYDVKTENILLRIKFLLVQFIQSIRYLVLVHLKEIIIVFFDRFYDKIREFYHLKKDSIMGKKTLLSKGSASFYLKKIKEDKSNSVKGSIEDGALIDSDKG